MGIVIIMIIIYMSAFGNRRDYCYGRIVKPPSPVTKSIDMDKTERRVAVRGGGGGAAI